MPERKQPIYSGKNEQGIRESYSTITKQKTKHKRTYILNNI